jgi:beta-N-acetylglucosaminidase
MAEAVKDVTTMEEVAADLVVEEAQADSEVTEILVAKEEALEVSDQEVVETEVRLQDVKVVFHPIDLQEKADLEVKEVHQLQDENQVLLKEKAALQDALREVLTDQQVVHLTKLKLEDREEAKLS